MKIDRRSFLKLSGGMSAGMMTIGALGSLPFLTGCSQAEKQYKPFGIQLWTLRDILPENPAAVIEQLASFGYKQIESFEGEAGMFWGMGPAGFRDFIRDQGMELVASHGNIFEDFERKAGETAEAEAKYLICPWIGPQESLDEYRKMAEYFNECGKICKREGIQFAYHNHEYTFQKMDDIFPQDLLMQETDPDLVEYELDLYWVVTAGEDPAEWIKKYPGRFTLSHVKDRADAPLSETRVSVTLGTGVIDFPSLLKTARENGMKYFFVEQEEYEGTTPLESARDGADYMKELFKEG